MKKRFAAAIVGALLSLPILAACQPPPGTPVKVEQSPEQAKLLERIADALEEIAAKDCRSVD